MLFFALIQFLFALIGRFAPPLPDTTPRQRALRLLATIFVPGRVSGLIRSRDGFLKRQKTFFRLLFSPATFAAFVEGQAAMIAEQMVEQREQQAKVDRLKAQEHRRRSTHRR